MECLKGPFVRRRRASRTVPRHVKRNGRHTEPYFCKHTLAGMTDQKYLCRLWRSSWFVEVLYALGLVLHPSPWQLCRCLTACCKLTCETPHQPSHIAKSGATRDDGEPCRHAQRRAAEVGSSRWGVPRGLRRGCQPCPCRGSSGHRRERWRKCMKPHGY